MRIRLSDADRERFGCEEWLPVDLPSMTNREAAAIQQAYGFNDNAEIADAFNAQYQRDEDGNFVQFKPDYRALDAVVWLALRQVGALTGRARSELAAELDGLEYEVIRVRIGGDGEPEGKDESSTPDRTSPPSSARTRQRSSRRSTGSAGTR
jgi:hypothetical protein